jgi:hypothetical protein
MLKSFKNYRNLNEDDSAPVVQNAAINLDKEIDRIIDGWVEQLTKELLNPERIQLNKRGLWDRFKGSLSNLWHGRDNMNNPYYWKNQYGDVLGSESYIPLVQYKSLKETCDNLEQEINEVEGQPNLKIIQIIKNAAEELKYKLKSVLTTAQSPQNPVVPQHTTSVDASTPMTQPESKPETTPEKPNPNDAFNSLKPKEKEEENSLPVWSTLQKEEIEQWNQKGGGLCPERINGCLNHVKGNPIIYLPWILRTNDPRIDVLKSQSDNTFFEKYLDQESASKLSRKKGIGCKNHIAKVFKYLNDTGRIEGSSYYGGKPFENEKEFMEALHKVQALDKKAKIAPPPVAAPMQEVPGEAKEKTEPNKDGPVAVPMQEVPGSSNKPIWHHTNDTEGLSKPAHKETEAEPEENSEVENKKRELIDLVADKLAGDDFQQAKEWLWDQIKNAKTPDEVKDVEEIVKDTIESSQQQEWSLTDRKNWYVERFRLLTKK